MNIINKYIKQLIAVGFLIIGCLLAFFVWKNTQPKALYPFSLGLDLSGGSRLVYKADVKSIGESEINDSMNSVRDVIERRVNQFGVSEPLVQTETSSFGDEGSKHRLSVELPGITDLDQATKLIGQTPILEFKTENPKFDKIAYQKIAEKFKKSENKDMAALSELMKMEPYVNTELTGKYLKKASVTFDQSQTTFGIKPLVNLEFDDKGKKIFSDITSKNIGKQVAIFLDGQAISTPVVQSAITDGNAVITGNFTVKEAKELVGRLNSGALPVPVSLLSTSTIGPILGKGAVDASILAGIIAFIIICSFLILYYRLPGLIASVSLLMYSVLMLAIFMIVPITLTAAGIAAFIISLGIAVDANILISERIKEELRKGRSIYDAVREGFVRAWTSIRDANITSLISAVVLFMFGTSLIKGFAIVFGLGTIISMFSAITVCRYYMLSLAPHSNEVSSKKRWLFGAGFTSKF